MPIRLGRIGYLNVLPIYHPIESGLMENEFEIVSGPPAELNQLMAEGKLELSAASSIAYARNPENYYLIPDIAIGSRGPVQSVLLLSRRPVQELAGQTILVSAQTHTSAALLRILLAELWGVETGFTTGNATSSLEDGKRPEAILAIGDEALNLRYHPDYPYRIDLGEAWRELTGLPFIFGVWIVQRESWESNKDVLKKAAESLIQAKKWGVEHLPEMCTLAAGRSCLTDDEMCSYFSGLVYDFGRKEQEGLLVFYSHLHANGIIDAVPDLEFLP